MTTITAFGTNSPIYIPSWTTSTNLGPLPTTAFPSDCLSQLWNFNTNGLGMPWTQMTQGCAAKTCCPYGNFYTEPWAWVTSYYSPGVCPSQYRSCPGPSAPSALSTASGETIAFCCPTNYNCPSIIGSPFFQYCQSQLSTATTVIVVDNIFNQKTLSTSTWTPQPGYELSWQAVYPIQVRTRAIEVTPTAAPSPGTTASSVSGLTPSQSLSPSPTTATERSNSLLSPGAIAGIVISATCSVLGLLFGAGFKIWKYKRQQKQQAEIQHSGSAK
ncbi:hypothetical protein BGZ60DRAFT_521140 [Tricladium varicosporioides]|nr:hypothetical protein BGZ60DRAFT_521140 [Hymenoscyphus varicosporioides]